jgi:4-amino-4-deoxy-L-arabinose transferase-like glycosyltransferase
MRVSLRALPALFGTARHGPILEHCQVRRHVRLLVGLSLLVVGSGIGLRDPWGVDEERFLGVAREMLQNGSWLVLHRAGEPYPDKPPLFMWLLALASHVTGAPRVAFRLPGLLAGLVGTLCVYDLGRRLWTRGVGLVAGLLFVATIQSLLVLKAGQTDALLILWTTLGLYGLVRHLTAGPSWGWYAVASVAMGLGVLTKGVGFLPLLLFVPYAEGRRRGFRGLAYIGLADRRWLVGPVLLLGTVAVWLGPLLIRVASSNDPTLHAYAWNLLVKQTAIRMVAAEQHREPFWYFLVQVIPILWLPIVAGLPWLVWAWRRRLARGDGRLALLLGWVVLVVLFFSLSSGKRSLYIYPAVPALALAAAPTIAALAHRLGSTPGRRRALHTGTALWFLAMITWGFVEPFMNARDFPRRAVMAHVARRIGPERELALIHWRDGHWLFAQNPLVHFGYRGGADQTGQALTWLRERPDRWLLASDRWLTPCFDMTQAVYAGHDRGRDLFLVDARMGTGRCPAQPIQRLYRFRWERPYGALLPEGRVRSGHPPIVMLRRPLVSSAPNRPRRPARPV